MPSQPLRHRAIVAVLLLVGWLFSGSTSNAQLVPAVEVGSLACIGRTTLAFTNPLVGCDVVLGIAPSKINQPSTFLAASYSPTSVPVNMTVNNSAVASFGLLRAMASANLTVTSTPVFAASSADAIFRDVVTISFPPFNGQPGLLLIQYTLSGTNTATGILQTEAGVSVSVSGPGLPSNQSCLQVYTSPVTAGVFTCASTFRFIYGQPFALVFSLGLGTETVDINTGSPRTGIGLGTGASNFSNTLVLSGLQIFDANGNPLPSSPTIEAASGTKYSTNGVLNSFAEFSVEDVELELEGGQFETNGSFTLSADSKGIDPITQEVAIQVGNFSAVIPPGLFKLEQGLFKFQGIINDVALNVAVQPSGQGTSFTFRTTGQGANLSGVANPVEVRLIIGNDGGNALAKVEFD